ncbi:MAG: hypothetical protein D6714_18880 [Bacteroidetes bacterium]|nr:MAG: hypothetical protein D6714_18880 [Bacteroidota bacterium]
MTFKAPFIHYPELRQYYKRQLIPGVFSLILLGAFVGLRDKLPFWAGIILVLALIIAHYFYIQSIRKIEALKGEKTIEISPEAIKITTKDGAAETVIPLDKTEKIIAPQTFRIPEESPIIHLFRGIKDQNYLDLYEGGKSRRLSFLPSSEYAIVQLEKILTALAEKGIEVERV